jgi:hypothetical protein
LGERPHYLKEPTMANATTYFPTTTGTYPTDTDKIVAIDTTGISLPARVAYRDEACGYTHDLQVYTPDALARVYAAKCRDYGTRSVTITPGTDR